MEIDDILHLIVKVAMKKNALSLCLMLLILGCFDKPRFNKDFVYSTLNDIFRNDSISTRFICGKFDLEAIPPNIQQEFFSTDSAFLQEQVKNQASLLIDTGRLFYYSKKRKTFEKAIVDTNCSQGIVYHVCFPVFSKDLQTVVVGVTEDCNCFLGGWGYRAVYKKQNGKWIFVKKFDQWIS